MVFHFHHELCPTFFNVSFRGHNELDLPGITSPLMYEKIAARKSVPELYEHKLLVRLTFPELWYTRKLTPIFSRKAF